MSAIVKLSPHMNARVARCASSMAKSVSVACTERVAAASSRRSAGVRTH